MNFNTDIIKGDSVALAVSGGADSVAMLLFFVELQKKLNLKISVRHFEHGIRGEESRSDARFVENLCSRLNVPFFMKSMDVPGFARENRLSIEEAARLLRYRFLTEALEEQVAVAHNLDDNAETVIFNLLRGSGSAGLKGIQRVTTINGKRIIRPLLDTKRAEIEKYLEELGESYRSDSSNGDSAYSRNKIRNEILPLLCEINPKAKENIVRSADIIESLSIGDESMLIKELIHEWLKSYTLSAKDISYLHMEKIYKLLESAKNRETHIPGYVVARKENDLVLKKNLPLSQQKLLAKDKSREEGTRSFNLSYEITFNVVEKRDNTKILKDTYTKQFDYDKILCGFSVRTCKEGDYFTIDSRGSKKSYRRYCIDEKIPADIRGDIPLIVDGSHILWAVGYRISEYYKVSAETKHILEITAKEQ